MTAICVDLCSVPADFGQGANDGGYYPVGLLTIASHLRRVMPDARVRVVDLHHQPDYQPRADIVGISASSTLNYRNVLSLARRAKAAGAIVVLGGPHVTQLAEQVLRNRSKLVDAVVRGNGEVAFGLLVKALEAGHDLRMVPGVSWLGTSGEPIHNPLPSLHWTYDNFLPLDLSLLSCGVEAYWETFNSRIDRSIDAAFIVFTHFGCDYRERMQRRATSLGRIASWCSYCSLNDSLSTRSGNAIVSETLGLLRLTHVCPGSNILLKRYGDNVGAQHAMLSDLARAIEESDEWGCYRIEWTFYAQSSRVSPQLADLHASLLGVR